MESYAYSLKHKKYVKFDKSNSDGLLYLSRALNEMFSGRLKAEAERSGLEEESRRRAEELKRQRGEATRRAAETEAKRRLENKKHLNAYAMFDLTSGASASDIHKNYVALALKYHPDKFADPAKKNAAEEMMKRINRARDSLLADLLR